MNASDGDKQIPIMLAMEKNNCVVTKMLTEYGVYINIFGYRENDRLTPIHTTSMSGDSVLVKYLLQHGADKDAQTLPSH